MNSLPLVSVIVPCYNSEEFILDCLKSILAQDYENYEVIVVDDGSTDRSLELIKSCPEVKVVSQSNAGACVARNKGLYESRGKYIKFLDSDDLLEPGCLSAQVIVSEALPDSSIVYGDYFILNGSKSTLKRPNISGLDQTASLVLGNLMTSTPLHKRWMLEAVQGFDIRFPSGQEWNLHIRLSSKGYKFVYDSFPTYKHRVHDSVHRITNKRYREVNFQAVDDKLQLTIESLGECVSGDALAAFSKAYWWLARSALRNKEFRLSECFSDKSLGLSNNFKKFWPLYYRVLYNFLGFSGAEKVLGMAYRFKSKGYAGR